MKRFLFILVTVISLLPSQAKDFSVNYSTVGVMCSERPIPDVPVVMYVGWQGGDQSARLQNAIDYLSSRKADKRTGLRGAILLGEGRYELSEPLRIQASGIVVRGMGRGKTILYKRGVDRGAVVYIEGREGIVRGDTINPSEGRIGEKVIVWQQSTKDWIRRMGCENFGGGSDLGYWGWHPKEIDVLSTRTIAAMNGAEPVFDIPLTSKADAVKLIKIRADRRIRLSGVENMTIESDYDKANIHDENHAWDGVYIANANDCWVRIVDFRHLAGSAVVTQRTASQITVEDCRSYSPVSEIGGYRRRTFLCMGERCLFQRLYSEHGINDFAVFLCAAGPNVFSQCDSYESLGFSGSLGPWATGVLLDCVNIDGNDIHLSFDGLDRYGSGWTTTNSTAYQCSAAGIYADSVPDGTTNTVYGCWAQFNGTGDFSECNNHVKPWSLFHSQLKSRIQNSKFKIQNPKVIQNSKFKIQNYDYSKGSIKNTQRVGAYPRVCPSDDFVEKLTRTLERETNNVSNNPTYAEADSMALLAHNPRMTMEMWIEKAQLKEDLLRVSKKVKTFKYANTSTVGADPRVCPLGTKGRIKSTTNNINADCKIINNGKILNNGRLIVGRRQNAPWWNGRVRYSRFPKIADGVTRFVPEMESQGTTTRIDSVADHLKKNNVALYNQNYGLWYDRRRDDHERIRRRDGDVWAPFYEQAVARSGQGKAWDGLSKYDLGKLNTWYVDRIKRLAHKTEQNGTVIINQHYFQHNILEAGAHWVDCPWRPTNNINGTVFPEPVPFAGDKRVYMASYFYNIKDTTMARLHRTYIFNMLDAFADNPNIIHSIGEEYTGPYEFTKFWLQTVAEWEKKTGKKATVALSVNKNIQDSILQDKSLADVVDIINIEQWWMTKRGLYAPDGGHNMAPRQYFRRLRPGKVTFDNVYSIVREYRQRFPEKAVVYYGGGYDQLGLAVLMAGGSCPCVKVTDDEFLKDVATMNPIDNTTTKDSNGKSYMMANANGDMLVYIESGSKTTDINGKMKVSTVDEKSGAISKNTTTRGQVIMSKPGIYWIRK